MALTTSRLRSPAYVRLLAAQLVSLLGTGLLTVGLSLLAFDVAPRGAGAVVGTVLTIKIVAYVLMAPLVGAVVARLPARRVLVGADVVRLLVAASLPWVDQVWQIYVLVFVLQAASAAHTPAYQALLPEVLPDEVDYTRALSFSRLAYDLESVLSPVLAAALLLVMTYHGLFAWTAIGFLGSAVLVVASGTGRDPRQADADRFRDRVAVGTRWFGRHRPLRALLLLDLAVAGSTAVVLVNTVVVVREVLGRGEVSLALALGSFGAGSMVVALLLPRVLLGRGVRGPMLLGGAATAALLVAGAGLLRDPSWPVVLVLWAALGAAASLVLTPAGRVVVDTVDEASRPAVFAAHFSLSHACYLLTYPIAGWVGRETSVAVATALLAAVSTVAAIAAALTWRTTDARRAVAP